MPGWHNSDWLFTVSYADGHASYVKMKGSSGPRLSEYPGCAPDTDCFTYWRCVVNRGIGWQKDTLPSPPVRTNVSVPSG